MTDLPRRWKSRDRLYQPAQPQDIAAIVTSGISRQAVERQTKATRKAAGKIFRAVGASTNILAGDIRRLTLKSTWTHRSAMPK
jgi:hypothetical protein